ALVLYTDGSKSDAGRTGSGVYAKAEDGLVFRCRFRNPDNCSVFRSELLAIREALNFALHFENCSCAIKPQPTNHFENSDIYILTDSKSSIQYLKIGRKFEKKPAKGYFQNCYTFAEK
ncbi:hypothetical protein AVEN_58175-1, partial [Araneus ventricosus]